MAKFREKSVVVEAVQLRWDTWSEMCEHAKVGKLSDGKPEGNQDGEAIGLDIPTKRGLMHASENDWIIIGGQGELYVSTPANFEQTYEAVV